MKASVPFQDRRSAGRQLAELLAAHAGQHPVIAALPRGGVPVGAEVARALRAPLELLVVRKIGAPRQPEYAVGAIAEDGTTVLDDAAITATGMTREQLKQTVRSADRELRRRVDLYRSSHPARDVRGRTVIVVDDGLATGMSALAGVRAARAVGAGRVVVAAPVGSFEAVRLLEDAADAVQCLLIPPELLTVGTWYRRFDQVSDREVRELLAAAVQPAHVR